MVGARLGRDAADPPPHVPAAGLRPPPQDQSILSGKGDGGSRSHLPGREPLPGTHPGLGAEGPEQRPGGRLLAPTPDPPASQGAVGPSGPQLIRLAGTRVPNQNFLPICPLWRRCGPEAPVQKGRLGERGDHSHHRSENVGSASAWLTGLCVCVHTGVHVRVWWSALPKEDGLKTSRNGNPQ